MRWNAARPRLGKRPGKWPPRQPPPAASRHPARMRSARRVPPSRSSRGSASGAIVEPWDKRAASLSDRGGPGASPSRRRAPVWSSRRTTWRSCPNRSAARRRATRVPTSFVDARPPGSRRPSISTVSGSRRRSNASTSTSTTPCWPGWTAWRSFTAPAPARCVARCGSISRCIRGCGARGPAAARRAATGRPSPSSRARLPLPPRSGWRLRSAWASARGSAIPWGCAWAPGSGLVRG